MSLGDWGKREEKDAASARRLATSYATAIAVVAGLVGAGVVFGGQIKARVFEEEVEVKFVPPEPVKVEAAKPPPPPPPPPKVKSFAPAALGRRRDTVPTEMPREAPDERAPSDAVAEGPEGEGDPNGVVGGTGRGGAPSPIANVAPAPPAPPAPVRPITEVTTPPIVRSRTMPAYPAEARAQGIEALVVVKFVVDEMGRVEDVTIVRGHPLFDEVVRETVRTWLFDPATLEGKTVRTVRMVKIPFRLKHS